MTFVDGFVTLANLFIPKLDEGSVVPAPFEPTAPPPFAQMPGTAILCWVARRLGKRFTPEWIREWSTWEGVGHKGQWGEALKPVPGASRCGCPALNVSRLSALAVTHAAG